MKKEFYLFKTVCSCKTDRSCKIIFVQFYPLVQKYIRPISCTRAIQIATQDFIVRRAEKTFLVQNDFGFIKTKVKLYCLTLLAFKLIGFKKQTCVFLKPMGLRVSDYLKLFRQMLVFSTLTKKVIMSSMIYITFKFMKIIF